MKCIWKLAYQVLETWVSYLIWVLETHFPLVDLDRFLPHRSRVFYTQFQYMLRTELNTQKRRKPREERRKKETQQKERKKKTHGTHKPSLHQAHPDRRSMVQFTISIGAVWSLKSVKFALFWIIKNYLNS